MELYQLVLALVLSPVVTVLLLVFATSQAERGGRSGRYLRDFAYWEIWIAILPWVPIALAHLDFYIGTRGGGLVALKLLSPYFFLPLQLFGTAHFSVFPIVRALAPISVTGVAMTLTFYTVCAALLAIATSAALGRLKLSFGRGALVFFGIIFVLPFVLPFVGGTRNPNIDRVEWKEEVQLATGEVVVVERVVTSLKSGFPASSRGPVLEQSITFPDGRIVWNGKGMMYPLALEMAGGKNYMAVNLRNRELCKAYNNPPSSTLFFRWDGQGWLRIGRDEFPAGGKANLLLYPWGRTSAADVSGLVRNTNKKRVRPGNDYVDEPLDKLLAKQSLDACQMVKKNWGE